LGKDAHEPADEQADEFEHSSSASKHFNKFEGSSDFNLAIIADVDRVTNDFVQLRVPLIRAWIKT